MLVGTKTVTSTVAVLVFGPLDAPADVLLVEQAGDRNGTLALATSAVDVSTSAGKAAAFFTSSLSSANTTTFHMNAGESLYAAISSSGGTDTFSWLVSYV